MKSEVLLSSLDDASTICRTCSASAACPSARLLSASRCLLLDLVERRLHGLHELLDGLLALLELGAIRLIGSREALVGDRHELLGLRLERLTCERLELLAQHPLVRAHLSHVSLVLLAQLGFPLARRRGHLGHASLQDVGPRLGKRRLGCSLGESVRAARLRRQKPDHGAKRETPNCHQCFNHGFTVSWTPDMILRGRYARRVNLVSCVTFPLTRRELVTPRNVIVT